MTELVDNRYLHSAKVSLAVDLTLAEPGHCQWCNGELVGRAKRFCPVRGRCWLCWDTAEMRDKNYHQCLCGRGTYEVSKCAYSYRMFWYVIPRFKRAVFLRDDFTCQACQVRPTIRNEYGVILPDVSQLAIDHIHPYARGGKTQLDNLQVLCRPCNGRKSAKVGWEYSRPEPMVGA
jgi:hypothetical protein